jgi:2-polyprenyl-3-methyl-5-hydroxy-6-metoxy-1,4-benzoquinol methylase
MDQPDLEEPRHLHALRGLARINWWSGSARILWPALRHLARQTNVPLRVLDLATGSGDIPLRLWRKARAARLPMELAGCDVSPTAIALARRQAAHARANINFFCSDVLGGPVPEGFDVLTSSLFLHHLEENQALSLLRRAAGAAGRMLLFNDLRRSALGLLAAFAVTRLLTTSSVVHIDGPLSVRAAFTLAEAGALARQAGLNGATVVRKWPFRYLMMWRKE